MPNVRKHERSLQVPPRSVAPSFTTQPITSEPQLYPSHHHSTGLLWQAPPAIMATGSVDMKLLKQTKFPPEFNQKVDMKKVNLEVMKKCDDPTFLVTPITSADMVQVDCRQDFGHLGRRRRCRDRAMLQSSRRNAICGSPLMPC